MIIQGDCAVMMQDIPSLSVDMIITSPPYDGLRSYNGYTFDFEAIANEMKRVLKVGGVIVWVVGDATVNGSETGTSFKQALYFKEIGLNLHDTMIWSKPTCQFPETNRYYNTFEYMFVLSKGKPKTTNLIKDKRNLYYGEKIHSGERQVDGSMKLKSGAKKGKITMEYGVRSNVRDIRLDNSQLGHPAPYSEDLVVGHILSWSNEGDTILDPMCGSGTSLKVAKLLKRNYIGIEISPEYIAIAEERLANCQDTLF